MTDPISHWASVCASVTGIPFAPAPAEPVTMEAVLAELDKIRALPPLPSSIALTPAQVSALQEAPPQTSYYLQVPMGIPVHVVELGGPIPEGCTDLRA